MMLHFHPDDVEATMPCAIFLTFKKNKIYTLSTNVLLLSPRVPLEKCVNCVWPIYLRGMAQPRFQGSQSRAPAGVSLRPDIHVFWGRKEPESPVKKKSTQVQNLTKRPELACFGPAFEIWSDLLYLFTPWPRENQSDGCHKVEKCDIFQLQLARASRHSSAFRARPFAEEVLIKHKAYWFVAESRVGRQCSSERASAWRAFQVLLCGL